YPTAFGRWLSAAEFALGNTKQVAVMYGADGADASALLRVIQSTYRPNLIMAASAYPPPPDSPTLLMERPLKEGQTTVYVCEGFVCKNPVTSALELDKLL
ncbi:MAG TPA: hypothetical protein VN653_05475, partial [Anaerolineales bacterium]|nr:hypothetical protein [Anaerolineales bacterium]